MFNRIHEINKQPLAKIATIASLAAIGLGASGCNKPNQAPEQKAEEPITVMNVEGLARGDKYTRVRVFKPEDHIGETIAFDSQQKNTSEDLVFIYSEKLSDRSMEIAGVTEEMKGYGTGLVITELPNGLTKSLVVIEKKTKKVIEISAPVEMKSGLHPIMENLPTGEFGYKIQAQRTGEGLEEGITLVIKKADASDDVHHPTENEEAA